jgi:TetR/AcrR family fatty acid metabolism transcriptional regulator
VSNESPFISSAKSPRPRRKAAERTAIADKKSGTAPADKRKIGSTSSSTPADKRKIGSTSSSTPADKRKIGSTSSSTPAADKRERILRAAVKVFARKGFYAARVSEIAKAAGVADGTIYLYFENKDDVLVSLFDDRLTRLIAVLEREVATEGLGFEQRFRRVVELQLGLLDGQRDLAEVVTVNLRQSTRLLKQYATPLFTKYLDVMARLIGEGQREGVVRADVAPRIVARSLWGALDALALTWAIGGGEPGHLAKAGKQVGDIFLSGIATPVKTD